MPQHLALKIKTWLSHHPLLYAFFGGIGVVLFWRGVWHTTDFLMQTATIVQMDKSTDLNMGLWWDGPLSLLIGSLLLLCMSAFVSSLIGNEIIISGLRAERSQLKKEDKTLHSEAQEIHEVRNILAHLSKKVDHLENDFAEKNPRG